MALPLSDGQDDAGDESPAVSAPLANRIVLHVGAHKTGSTYLQRRMREGAPMLRAAGIHVPAHPLAPNIAGNAKLLATALAGAPSPRFARVFPRIDVAALDPAAIAATLLAEWRRDREALVLSAENFRPGHAPRLAALLPRDAEIAVVLFVRRQDEWSESYYNQLVKTGDIHLDFPTFLGVIRSPDGDERIYRPDWLLHYRSWRAAFGDCRIVFYDESRDDLLAAFLAAAALPPIAGLPEIERKQVSLDFRQLAWLTSLGPTLPFAEFRRRRAAAAEAARRSGPPPRHSLLDSATRAALGARFAESNRGLLAQIGREAAAHYLAPASAPPPHMPVEAFRDTADYASFRDMVERILAAPG